MSKVHTPEMQIAELTESLNFVRQKYGIDPVAMEMNRHTRDELANLASLANCSTPDFSANIVLWEDIPVRLDESRDDHVIVYVVPESGEENLPNEPSLLVSNVQSEGSN